MSTLPRTAEASRTARSGTRRRICLVATVVVLGWSTIETVSLVTRHTAGAEIYGVLVAAVAVGASAAGVVLLRSPRRRPWASAAVLVVWAVIALGGIGGMVAHIVGPVPGHGPVDARPRPVAAPLIFTALALVGGTALVVGQSSGNRPTEYGEE